MNIRMALLKFLSLFFILIIALGGCQSKEDPNTVKIGTIEGPETQLMEVAQKVAQDKYQLNVKIIPFTDYALPNRALHDGSIDINMFQTIPYLDADNKAHGYNLKIAGKSFIYPMALYSKKFTSVQNIPEKSIVAIPNDPSNEARALILMQKAGLITLKSNANTLATPHDIIRNPKKLEIKEIDAAQLPRVLSDVSLAAINTNYAILADLYPSKDGLVIEDKSSPYVNVFAVRSGSEHDPKIEKLIKAFQSDEVKKKADEIFAGQVITGW